MNKRTNMADLLANESGNDINDFDDLDLGAPMTSSADIKESKATFSAEVKPPVPAFEIPAMNETSPFYIKQYPDAYRARFDRLKAVGGTRGAHSGFVQEAVEKLLNTLEEEYKDKLN